MADQRAIVLQSTGLTKAFAGRTVLRGIDFEAAAGQLIAIAGENGAGKSTLLHCLAGLTRPTSGEVKWFDQPLAASPENRRLIGVSLHSGLVYPRLTARENLVFAARMYGLSRPSSRANQWLHTVGLEAHAARLSAQLSRGLRQRLALARALIHEPRVVLLDEPFSGLDAQGDCWLETLLIDLCGRECTACLTTHNEAKAHDLCDRILRLERGALVEVEIGRRRTRAANAPRARAA